jgi:FkbM family methyltransferase
LNLCVSDFNGETDFTYIEGFSNMLSGISDKYNQNHKERILREVDHYGGKIHNINVPVRTLESILDEYNVTEVDFCSIDTEGSELSIVKSINFDKTFIKVFIIENNYQESTIEDFLKTKGFFLYKKIEWDDVFVNEKLIKKKYMKHFYNTIDSEVWFDYQNVYSYMVKKFPSGSHFVEVGSWKGMSSCYMAVEIINSEKEIKFDCVDFWEYTPTQKDIHRSSFNNLYEIFKKNTSPVSHVINDIKMLSHEASKLYSDGTLDFIYIDGAHDYDNVKLDIESWFPKLKIGGIIAGHSYTHPPVKTAVDEFFGIKNIKFIHNSWSFEKTKSEIDNREEIIEEIIIPFDYEEELKKVKNNILVSAISFVNTVKKGSEIYTTFAKRLIKDVLTKTPYDIMVSTNAPEYFEEYSGIDRVFIKHEPLYYHKTHVGAFNQLLKFYAIKEINKKYDWVLYLDCDAGLTEKVNVTDIDNYLSYLDSINFDMSALRTQATYEESEREYIATKDKKSFPVPLFNKKFMFYGFNDKWRGAKLPSEHILLIKNNEKLPVMAHHFENFCSWFETQEPNNIITFDMEAFEIGVSAHLAGFNMDEMTWGRQCEIFKVGFNYNNWEKIKV